MGRRLKKRRPSFFATKHEDTTRDPEQGSTGRQKLGRVKINDEHIEAIAREMRWLKSEVPPFSFRSGSMDVVASSRSALPDLGTKCQVDEGPNVRAIGWLSSAHPFATGDVPPGFLETLKSKMRSASTGTVCLGFHVCELCRDVEARGMDNVRFRRHGLDYIAPELIVHYIEQHHYLPPLEFIDAVYGSPEHDKMALRVVPLRLSTIALMLTLFGLLVYFTLR